MAAPVKRAPLPTPTIADLGEGLKSHGSNPHVELNAITPSRTVTCNQQYEESLYEDPDALSQQLSSYEYDAGKVCLTFGFV